MSELTETTGVADGHDAQRAHIIAAAADLLAREGREALTTRAVAAAAGVQAPTLYRLFGDKEGLLDAVAEFGFAAHLKDKTAHVPGADPLAELRAGWDLHVAFGLANPGVYALMYGDPRPGERPSAAVIADRILDDHIHRLAAAGLLRVSEAQAADLVRAVGRGTVLTLLSMPDTQRDLALSRAACDAVTGAVTRAVPVMEKPTAAAAAVALRALLPEVRCLSDGERQLIAEWLERIASH